MSPQYNHPSFVENFETMEDYMRFRSGPAGLLEQFDRSFHPESRTVGEKPPLPERTPYGLIPDKKRPQNFYYIVSIAQDSIDSGNTRKHNDWEHLILTHHLDHTYEVTKQTVGLTAQYKTGYWFQGEDVKETSAAPKTGVVSTDLSPFDGWWATIQVPDKVLKIEFFTKRDLHYFLADVNHIVHKKDAEKEIPYVPMGHSRSLEGTLARVNKNPYVDTSDLFDDYESSSKEADKKDGDANKEIQTDKEGGKVSKKMQKVQTSHEIDESDQAEPSQLSDEECVELVKMNEEKQTDVAVEEPEESELSELSEDEWEDLTGWMEAQKL